MALSKGRIEAGKTGIGGSEIATVCGFNPHESVQELWQQKLGLVEPVQTTPAMERGLFLEDGIIRWSAHRTGLDLRPNKNMVDGEEVQVTMRSDRHQLCFATPDGCIMENDKMVGAVQVKSPGLNTMGDWADPEEIPDGIPMYVLPQIMWEMEASGCREVPELVSALVGGDIRIYRIGFNDEMIKLLFGEVEKFWGFVEREEPPPHDDSAKSAEWIRNHYRQKQENLVQVKGHQELEMLKYVTGYNNAAQEIKKLEVTKKNAAAHIQDFVRDRAGVEGAGWKCSWKTDKHGRINYKKCVDDLSVDESVLEGYRGPAPRRFLVSMKKGK